MTGPQGRMRPSSVLERIEAGDVDGLVTLFSDWAEPQRRAVAPDVIRAHRAAERAYFDGKGHYEGTLAAPANARELRTRRSAALVALLAVATEGELRKLGAGAVPHHDLDDAVAVWRDRRPGWLPGYADFIAAVEDRDNWPVVRRLVLEGLIPTPRSDEYVLAMLRSSGGWTGGGNLLDADPALLADEVWRAFEVQRPGAANFAAADRSFSSLDPDPRGTWSWRLREHAAGDERIRARLLEASAGALARDYGPQICGWFSAFHEKLEPTIAERAALVPRYRTLLTSPIPATATFALRALDRVDRAAPLAGRDLVPALTSVLGSDRRTTVRVALTLLGRIVAREPALAHEASRGAAAAVGNPDPDVQRRALALIAERTGGRPDAATREVLVQMGGLVAPTVAPDWRALLADDDAEPASETAGAVDLGALAAAVARVPAPVRGRFRLDEAVAAVGAGRLPPALCLDPLAVPVLDPERALVPVDSVEALLELAARCVEDPAATDDLELVLDGVARLCRRCPDDLERRIAPLRKRVAQREQMALGHGLATLIAAWIDQQPPSAEALEEWRHPEREPAGWNPSWRSELWRKRLWPVRVAEVAQRVSRGVALPVLATPTHRGGWIAPVALVTRLVACQQAGCEPARVDLIQALMRVAWQSRPAALASADSLHGETGAIVRFALGGEPAELRDAALHLAAFRCRHPVSDSAPAPDALVELGPGGAALPQYRLSLEPNDDGGGMMLAPPLVISVDPEPPAREDPELLAVRLSVAGQGRVRGFLWGVGFDPGEAQRLRAIWPFGRAAHWARAIVALAWCVDGAERARGNPDLLTPLLDTTEPVTSEAVHALVLAQGGKAPDARAVAVDATIQTIADGRLDGETLGETAAWWVGSGIVRCGRLATPWADVAAESPLHCAVMRQAAERLVAALPAPPPRDLHALLEAWLEWCVTQRGAVGDRAARRVLEQVTGGGKSARLARRLLALERDDADAMKSAGAAAIRARLARADRARR